DFGVEPHLAGAALDLVCVVPRLVRQWCQASSELDHISVAIVPVVEQREIVDDFLDCHRPMQRLSNFAREIAGIACRGVARDISAACGSVQARYAAEPAPGAGAVRIRRAVWVPPPCARAFRAPEP